MWRVEDGETARNPTADDGEGVGGECGQPDGVKGSLVGAWIVQRVQHGPLASLLRPHPPRWRQGGALRSVAEASQAPPAAAAAAAAAGGFLS